MKIYKYFFLISLASLMISCGGTSEEQLIGDWQRRAVLPRGGRCHAATFVIGDNGYVVGGFNGSREMRREVFVFSHTGGSGMGSWQQLDPLPDNITARQQAVGFSVGSFGYVGTGWDGDETTMKDFWKFDPANDTWTEIAPLPERASPRRGAFAFSLFVGGKEYGFVGCGFTDRPDNEYLNDLWRFDPAGTTTIDGVEYEGRWDEVSGQSMGKRVGGVAFVIDNRAYICNGKNPINVNDFWIFDPDGEANGGHLWTRRRHMYDADPEQDYDDDYGTLSRAFGVAFVVDVSGELRGHVVGGETGFASTCWEYEHGPFDAPVDLWVERTGFFNRNTRQNREGMIAFSFREAGKAYVGLGRAGLAYYDDMWEFIPLEDDYTYDDYQ